MILKKSFFILLFIPVLGYCQFFAVIGDFRSNGLGTAPVAVLVKSKNPDFIVSTGDNFDLNNGTVDDQVGQYYHDFIYPYYGNYGSIATTNRFFPTLGNHELNSGGDTNYINYFTLPGNERYYKLSYENIDIFFLNSNSNEPDGVTDTSIQAQWLQEQIFNSTKPWKLLIFHHPAYTSGSHGSTVYMQWGEKFNGIDAVISGHDHTYERLSIQGVPYFVNGVGGANLYGFNTPLPESKFRYADNFGAQFLTVSADSILFQFYNINDSVFDTYILKKTNIQTSDQISVSPFIVQDQVVNFILKGSLNKNVKIEILSSEGKVVFSKPEEIASSDYFKINIPSLSNGMYIIKVMFESTFKVGRFVISQRKN